MEKITENNKLIFDFMGCVHSKHEDIDNSEMANLKYHTSWDWLMQVVEKIEELGYPFWLQQRKKASIIITFCNSGEDIIYVGNIHQTKIQNVFAAVIQFITWYNTNHPNNGK